MACCDFWFIFGKASTRSRDFSFVPRLTSHNIRTVNVKIKGSKELPSSLLQKENTKCRYWNDALCFIHSDRQTWWWWWCNRTAAVAGQNPLFHPSTYSYYFFISATGKFITCSFLNVKLCKSLKHVVVQWGQETSPCLNCFLNIFTLR